MDTRFKIVCVTTGWNTSWPKYHRPITGRGELLLGEEFKDSLERLLKEGESTCHFDWLKGRSIQFATGCERGETCRIEQARSGLDSSCLVLAVSCSNGFWELYTDIPTLKGKSPASIQRAAEFAIARARKENR